MGQLGLNAYGFASFCGHSAVDTWIGCLSDGQIVKDRGGIPSQPTGEPVSRSLGLALQPLFCNREADGCSLRSHVSGGDSLGDVVDEGAEPLAILMRPRAHFDGDLVSVMVKRGHFHPAAEAS